MYICICTCVYIVGVHSTMLETRVYPFIGDKPVGITLRCAYNKRSNLFVYPHVIVQIAAASNAAGELRFNGPICCTALHPRALSLLLSGSFQRVLSSIYRRCSNLPLMGLVHWLIIFISLRESLYTTLRRRFRAVIAFINCLECNKSFGVRVSASERVYYLTDPPRDSMIRLIRTFLSISIMSSWFISICTSMCTKIDRNYE